MESHPQVSIGVPVYNGAPSIGRALDALLAQEHTDFELIISDNCSTDRTGEICQAYQARDRRVRYERTTRNMGAAWNFQHVLDMARGQYFMWAAHDDYWAPAFVGSMLHELEAHPEAAVAMCATERVREDHSRQDVIRYEGRADPSLMSSFRLAWALAAGVQYHMYLYGLFRTDFLRPAFHDFPNVVVGDRLFVCQLALATKFRYVDHVMYVKQVRSAPIAVRYANEELGRIWSHPRAREKTVLAAGPYLWRSRIIPFRRKLYIPIVVLRLACTLLGHGRARLLAPAVAERLIGRRRWMAVRRLIVRALGRKPKAVAED